MFDLATAVVPKTPYMTVFEKKTVDVFCEELAGRSGVELFRDIPEAGKEGFRIRIAGGEGRRRLIVLGKDERGEFYGCARILRRVAAKNGRILCPEELDGVSMTPEYPLRGHQLGFRDKNNTYSAWTVKDFERYIRDMAMFGANAIELLPPKTDDALFSSTFVEDPFRLMIEVSRIIHSYHMDVWLCILTWGKTMTI